MRLGSELERESIPEKELPWQFVKDEHQLARDREDGEATGTGCANVWGDERARVIAATTLGGAATRVEAKK